MSEKPHNSLCSGSWSFLNCGSLTEVWTNGELVKRPLRPWSASVHQVLRHLELHAVNLVPRFVSVEESYEILTYLHGRAVRRPWPRTVQSVDWMVQIGRWLRTFHEATRGFHLTDDVFFVWGSREPNREQIVTHGDLGPWNMLESEGELTGIIDWDLSRFGYDLDDLTEVAFELSPLRINRDMLLNDPKDDEIYARLVALCHGYGMYEPKDLIQNVEPLIESRIQEITELATEGQPLFVSLVEAGNVSDMTEHLQYFRERFCRWLVPKTSRCVKAKPKLQLLIPECLQGLFTSTELERSGLGARINLTDGHCRAFLSPTQTIIVQQLPELWKMAQKTPQMELEETFRHLFFTLAGQLGFARFQSSLLSYSVSSGIKMVAGCLRTRLGSVLLVEPCFDNIARLIMSEGNKVVPISETDVFDTEKLAKVAGSNVSAIWLVMPNNPTGQIYDPDTFQQLAKYCRNNGIVLVCDCCFRFFSNQVLSWDQYEVMHNLGTSFVIFEDTGKTWPVLDMKIGQIVCSDDLYPDIYTRHDDLLLNVSPFHLVLLIQFLKDSIEQGLEKSVRELIEENRKEVSVLYQNAELCPASVCNSNNVPFEWIVGRKAGLVAKLLQRAYVRGVEILPGANFFWSKNVTQDYFRVPLSRPTWEISEGIKILSEELAGILEG